MTTKSLTIQLVGLLLLCLSLIYFVPILEYGISHMVKDHVYKTLQKEGFSWIIVQTKGRDISLKGNTLDEKQHKKALDVSRSIWFVRNINDEITPKIVEPYTLNFHWDGDKLSIDGYVKNNKDEQQLKHENKHKNTHYKLKIALGSPAHWQKLRTLIIANITQLNIASVRMIDKSIYIAGQVDTHKQRTRIHNLLLPFKKYQYRLIVNLIALDETALFCQENFDKMLKESEIHFKIGSAIIENKSEDLLTKLAENAVFCATSKIIITGHTDNQGDPQKNKELSLQRARAVKGKLFSYGGIPLERLETIGAGSDEPIDTNDTKQGRENNRRIEFSVKEL